MRKRISFKLEPKREETNTRSESRSFLIPSLLTTPPSLNRKTFLNVIKIEVLTIIVPEYFNY